VIEKAVHMKIIIALLITLCVNVIPAYQQDKTKQEKIKKPPAGPPWQIDYRQARWASLRTGKPLFFYFTKTV